MDYTHNLDLVNQSKNYRVIDFLSRKEVSPKNLIFADGDNPWEIEIDLVRARAQISIDYFKRSSPIVTKYLPFLPIANYSKFISLNEGSTPLLPSKHIGPELGIDLYFKPEFQNPTGSFKDRGSAVELTIAKEFNAPGISVASTGNMAASCSCYAASARIPCFVFVPEDTPSSKLSQVISYGGKIVKVKGDYNAAATLAEEVAGNLGFYLAGDYAFRVEGQKIAAFELIDQLFYQPPEMIFIPIGCGTNITAYAKGLAEYHQLGLIDKLPRLVGTQAEGAASVVNAFKKNSRDIEALKSTNTIASAISIAKPIDGVKALAAIYSSNGLAVSVSDREILEAQYLLSNREGLFVEASCATTLASIIKLKALGEDLSGKIICVLTGDGLKDPSPILKSAIKPPTINPTVDEFRSLYERSFFSERTVTFFDNSTVLFAQEPSLTDIEDKALKLLDIKCVGEFSNDIQREIVKFLKKGKKVSLSDFQDIIQGLLESYAQKNRSLAVLDFAVKTAKDSAPEANVKVSLDNELFSAESVGVGPVDAVINALRKACAEKLEFKLVNFEVAIRSEGTDAVVYAEMKLKKSDGSSLSLGRGTSPDVIQASIEAFENAYNGLLN
jgi:threonine synthase